MTSICELEAGVPTGGDVELLPLLSERGACTEPLPLYSGDGVATEPADIGLSSIPAKNEAKSNHYYAIKNRMR